MSKCAFPLSCISAMHPSTKHPDFTNIISPHGARGGFFVDAFINSPTWIPQIKAAVSKLIFRKLKDIKIAATCLLCRWARASHESFKSYKWLCAHSGPADCKAPFLRRPQRRKMDYVLYEKRNKHSWMFRYSVLCSAMFSTVNPFRPRRGYFVAFTRKGLHL